MSETTTAAISSDVLAALVTLGLWLFPCDHPALPRCIGRHAPDRPCGGSRGKHPEPRSWAGASTRDRATLAHMFGRGPRNAGIDCAKSSLIVIDADRPDAVERLCADHGQQVPHTFTVTTGRPGGGRHMYFRHPPGQRFGNSPGQLSTYGCDVRGAGGYVIAPGSLHQSGRTYTLAVSARIAPLPEWIGALLRPPAPQPHRPVDPGFAGSRQALVGILRVVINAAPGTRNSKLYWAAYRMFEKVRAGLLSDTAAEGMLLDAAAAVHLPEGEARGTITSARRAVLGD